MRVMISGGRDFKEEAKIRNVLDHLNCQDDVIIHGACLTGADRFADRIAHKMGFRVESYPAPWDREGKAAGPNRNQRMVDTKPNCAFFFWDGISPGTRDCIKRTIDAGIPYKIVPAKGREAVVAENHFRLLGVQVEMFDKPADSGIIEP